MQALKMTGDAMIPLMLISLGVRLSDVPWSSWRLGVIGGLVCPLTGIAMAALLVAGARASTTSSRACCCCSAACRPRCSTSWSPSSISRSPGKVASIVLIGNVLAIVFVPLGPRAGACTDRTSAR